MTNKRLLSVLDEDEVDYEVLHHRPDYLAQETAHDTHTPGSAFAKSVVVEAGERHALAVIPATRHVDLTRAAAVLGVGDAHLASEDTLRELFPDCDLGAEPPFGNLYGLPVFVDAELSNHDSITFNGGTHTEAVRMRFSDFARLVRPILARLTES